MYIGARIKQLRTEHKDSIRGLAKKLDYDWSNLAKIERGTYGLTHELLQKIIDVYDVQPSYFLGEAYTESELPKWDKKYKFIVDGVEASEREVIEAIRLIRHFRYGSD